VAGPPQAGGGFIAMVDAALKSGTCFVDSALRPVMPTRPAPVWRFSH
jgi:hypothetical protein